MRVGPCIAGEQVKVAVAMYASCPPDATSKALAAAKVVPVGQTGRATRGKRKEAALESLPVGTPNAHAIAVGAAVAAGGPALTVSCTWAHTSHLGGFFLFCVQSLLGY